MPFIKNGNQYVDLAAAASAEILGGVRGATALKLRNSAGREIGTVGGAATATFDIERVGAPVIPSGPVTTVICVSPSGTVTAAVIAGYRVCHTGLEPLYLVEPPEGVTKFLMVGAHGFVRLDDGEIFPDLASARRSVGGPVTEPPSDHAEIVDMPKHAGRRR